MYGYTCFYKSDTGKTDEIKVEELTISFVCRHYPRELFKHLEEIRHSRIEKQEEGIYYIIDELFSIQIIITSQLLEEENLWLKNLTNDLKENETAEKLIRDYSGHSKDERYKSVMDIIVRANEEQFKEAKKMCEALKELMKEELDESRQQGISQGISQGIPQGISQGISQGRQEQLLELIRKKIIKGKSIEEIAEELEETKETILPLYNRVKEEKN